MANKNRRTKARREKERKEAQHKKVVAKPIYKRPWIWIALVALVLGITIPSAYQYNQQAQENRAKLAAETAAKAEVEPLIWEGLQAPLATLGIAESDVVEKSYDLTGSAVGAYESATVTIKTNVRTIVAQCFASPASSGSEETGDGSTTDAAAEDTTGAATDDTSGAAAEDTTGAATEDTTGAATEEDTAAGTDEETSSAATEDTTGASTEDTTDAATEDTSGAAADENTADGSADSGAATWMCIYITDETGAHLYWSALTPSVENVTQAAVYSQDGQITMAPLYSYQTDEAFASSAAITDSTGSAVEDTTGAAVDENTTEAAASE